MPATCRHAPCLSSFSLEKVSLHLRTAKYAPRWLTPTVLPYVAASLADVSVGLEIRSGGWSAKSANANGGSCAGTGRLGVAVSGPFIEDRQMTRGAETTKQFADNTPDAVKLILGQAGG